MEISSLNSKDQMLACLLTGQRHLELRSSEGEFVLLGGTLWFDPLKYNHFYYQHYHYITTTIIIIA